MAGSAGGRSGLRLRYGEAVSCAVAPAPASGSVMLAVAVDSVDPAVSGPACVRVPAADGVPDSAWTDDAGPFAPVPRSVPELTVDGRAEPVGVAVPEPLVAAGRPMFAAAVPVPAALPPPVVTRVGVTLVVPVRVAVEPPALGVVFDAEVTVVVNPGRPFSCPAVAGVEAAWVVSCTAAELPVREAPCAVPAVAVPGLAVAAEPVVCPVPFVPAVVVLSAGSLKVSVPGSSVLTAETTPGRSISSAVGRLTWTGSTVTVSPLPPNRRLPPPPSAPSAPALMDVPNSSSPLW